MSQSNPPSSSHVPPNFIPLCPTCRYDLSGIPEGKCPECGRIFSLKHLQEEWFEKQNPGRAEGAGEFLLAFPTAISLLVWGAILYQEPLDRVLWVIGLIPLIFSAAWTALCRKQLLGQSPHHLLCSLLITLPMCMMAKAHLFWFALLAPLPWVLGALITWALYPARHRWVPYFLFFPLFLAPGIVGTYIGGVGVIRALYWSDLEDLFPGHGRMSIPLSNKQEMFVGLAFLAFAAAFPITWLCLRSKSVQHPSPPHHT